MIGLELIACYSVRSVVFLQAAFVYLLLIVDRRMPEMPETPNMLIRRAHIVCLAAVLEQYMFLLIFIDFLNLFSYLILEKKFWLQPARQALYK